MQATIHRRSRSPQAVRPSSEREPSTSLRGDGGVPAEQEGSHRQANPQRQPMCSQKSPASRQSAGTSATSKNHLAAADPPRVEAGGDKQRRRAIRSETTGSQIAGVAGGTAGVTAPALLKALAVKASTGADKPTISPSPPGDGGPGPQVDITVNRSMIHPGPGRAQLLACSSPAPHQCREGWRRMISQTAWWIVRQCHPADRPSVDRASSVPSTRLSAVNQHITGVDQFKVSWCRVRQWFSPG